MIKTPLDKEKSKRQDANAFLVKWISGSPSVTIELREDLMVFMKKNPDLLSIYLGGYTKYALQNKDSEDKVAPNVAALRAVIEVYNKGIEVKKTRK